MVYPGLVALCVLVLLCVSGPSRAQEHLESLENEKVCHGTSNGLVARGDWDFRYRQYQDLYTGCTYVIGNLEIVFLDKNDMNFDLSFLSSIRLVTGYVLIVGVHADYVPLTSLQIIRGKTLFHYPQSDDHYSLFVALNYDRNNKSIGLKELRFTSLAEILAGKVFFMNNNQLCYENTINWQDLNPYVTPPVEFRFNSTDYRRPCDTLGLECHASCYSNITEKRHCWGAGEGMCQKLSQGDACHPSCERRCFGKLPNQCCYQECAGGCNGPKKTDCFACRSFIDDGKCVSFCPPTIIYDFRQMINIINPDAKFAYGGICVKECPGFLLQDSGSCVRACPAGKNAKDGKSCEPCEGPCPRTCKGTEGAEFLNADNLKNFTDCTTIDGSLRILRHSFLEDPHYNIPPLHPRNLSVLNSVREITGFLLIQSDDKDFVDLSFLSNLEVIHGRQLDNGQSLNILGTPIRSLELTSLKSIRNGNVVFVGNFNLCYIHTINWTRIFYNAKEQKAQLHINRAPANCSHDGEVCNPQCSADGCWGKGPNKCLACRQYVDDEERVCLSSCSDRPMLYYAGNNKCKRCHAECANSCTGPENHECDDCAHVAILNREDGKKGCLDVCPVAMYSDENHVCQPCHPTCKGCTGPSDVVKEGGCNACEVGIRKDPFETAITCLPQDTDACEPGYHLSTVASTNPGPMAGRRVCEPCHQFCLTCDGPSVRYCTTCRYFADLDGLCIDFCPQYAYGDNITKKCIQCHAECRGICYGPSSLECTTCTNFKIYLDEAKQQFNCTPGCPASLPYQVRDSNTDENRNVCADESHPEVQLMLQKDRDEEKKKIIIVTVSTICGVLFLAGLLTLFGYYCQKRAKAKEKTAELTARMTGYDDIEPITPTNAQPDLAKLRLIKESELRKGGIIGSGAFGTVYKGFWIPEGENVKIPVAIKVLQDGTSPNQNKELLEEARVMASVEHVCCIRILAVCMSAQMMLITQLMPLGCLLDYVRKNKDHVGSKVLLNWLTQIAKGMTYLEDRGIVHRDLAARNVLVQTPTQVKITDFGLAKLLDYNEEEYRAAGGKMPIKWLALECIQHRIFTHKSDVWSFGVTAWELFTYGQKPYDNIRARDVPGLLEKGERLPQPSICTIDVYMIMIKCWMLDAESRPSFKELAEEFAKMARDPGRYLVVQGDVLKKIPEESFRGSHLDLTPIDGVEPPLGAVGEGDKLMRLPSHTFDKSDLMRSVSMTADGPEEIIEAEDYLQPQEPPHSPHQIIFENNNSPSAPLLPQGAVNYPLKAEKGEVSGLPWREKNYAHLNAAVEARKQRQQSPKRGREDSFNSRYSSDPIKFFREREEIEGPTSYPLTTHLNGSPTRKSSPTKVLQLAVDEDNYLAPHSANPVMYTDLSDKGETPIGYYQNEKVFEEYRDEEDEYETDHMLRGSPLHSVPAVANPEYFDHDDDDVWETKPMSNGRLPINAPTIFKSAPESAKCIYYNDLPQDLITIENVGGSGGGGGIGVDGGSRGLPAGRVTVREQRPSESRV